MVLVSLIIGAGTSLMASLLLTRPIGCIVGAMRELASGNYKTRLSFGELLNRNPTMKEITDSFNTMADELDHTEILRSDFINNFSHEFKTPIVSIAGFAKLLKRGNLSEEEKAEYTDIIEEESLRLSEMATNVLNLTKIENQTILTGVTRFNVSEQIRSCVLLLEEKWTAKELGLSLDFDEYLISANEEMLRQVWINLLDNAVKFADRGGEIRVRITKGGEILLVSVANTGSTVPPEERERIFRKFYQTDKSHSVAGNGIGLAVVREIVKLHRGSVSVSGESGFTVFTVALPCEEE
jgi:signal transduction histidine kinase